MTDASALSEAEANLPQVLSWDFENPAYCDTFWGSHGCGLPPGHEEPCRCVWDEWDEETEEVTHVPADESPCAPPYWGPETRFMSNNGTPIPPQTLAAARGETL